MAGLWCLKTLLLWAGIITLANCQVPNVTSLVSTVSTLPPRIMAATTAMPTDNPVSSHTPTPISMPMLATNNTTGISAITPPANTSLATTTSQNQTPPPITTSNTTVTATTQATTQGPVQCTYTIEPITFGFQFNIVNSTAGNYTIDINGGVEPKTVKHSNQSSSHYIKHLKPCIEYEHSVTFIDSAGNRMLCNTTENKTTTLDMVAGEITEGSCKDMSGHVCYQSEWDISSLMSASNNNTAEPCRSDDTTFCIKYGLDDICTDLTTLFKGCANSSFNRTKSITFDLLNPSEINPTIQNKLPPKIDQQLPPKCQNITVDYTCQGPNNSPVPLSDLEPFTDYKCTGNITYNNITKKTDAISVNINCDLDLNIVILSITSTMIDLRWETESTNCTDVNNLKLLSYDCSCNKTNKQKIHKAVIGKVQKDHGGGSCHIKELHPYTDYTCEVQPIYSDRKVSTPKTIKDITTTSGAPEAITKMEVTVIAHNVINVTCTNITRWNGPKALFIARLKSDNHSPKQQKSICSFQFEDLSYLTAYTLELIAYNGEFESIPKTRNVHTQYNDKAVIGFLVLLIIITSVALLLVIYKIYILKHRQSRDLTESMQLITAGNDEENLLPVEPIAAEALLDAYKRKLADEGRLFLAEFQSIPRIFSRYTVKEAKKLCNAPKNRYVDILPYDYNRVQLTSGNGDAGCDYINASYIDGYKESKKYIAAQGPKDETVSDFWRMVWEQQSSIIVMVTRCEEGNRAKCAQYWPSPQRETEIFDEFIVKLNSEDHCPDYSIRHLSLTNKEDRNTEREVTHIQFMSWPDHGVPGEPSLLLKLRRRVNAFKNLFSGPIVIHCSAGVGRTGSYIGIDAMMEGLEAEGRVDIYGYVVKLRRQRCLMVQVEAQYILIHQALLEHTQFGETEITLPELHSTLGTLKQKTSSNEPTLMEDEFDRLPSYKNWRTYNAGIAEENKKKNRSSTVIPYDYNRVLLKLDEGHSHDSDPEDDDEDNSSDEEDEESTKYINATHLDGYWGPRTFIAAQTPPPDSVADFLLMIFQKKQSAIVTLSDCSDGDAESECVYWGKDKKTFGDFEVEVSSTDVSPTFTTRNMLIHHLKRKESWTVKHFQFLKWGSGEVPENPQHLTDMIKDIKQSSGSSKAQRNMHVLVHCSDGSSRSGIFCALWNVLDSTETEKLVDVFQVVKTLRKERQGMISSLEQYQFLYDALERVFPVQNGEVKAAQASAADSVLIINETQTAEQPSEEKAEQPASTTNNDQQATAESSRKEEKTDEPEKVSSPTETKPQEETGNGPTVTVEG